MSEIKTKAKFEVKENELWVEVEHPHTVTAEEELEVKKIYQFKWQHETGKRIPLNEIKVRPAAGECVTNTTFFRFSSEIGIGTRWAISKLSLHVLNLVIKELEKSIQTKLFSASDIIVARKSLRALKKYYSTKGKK